MSAQHTCNADSLLVDLCKAYVDRRKNGIAQQQASQFSSEFLSTAEPFSAFNSDCLHNSLLELSQRKIVYYTLDGSCELTGEAVAYLDKQFQIM